MPNLVKRGIFLRSPQCGSNQLLLFPFRVSYGVIRIPVSYSYTLRVPEAEACCTRVDCAQVTTCSHSAMTPNLFSETWSTHIVADRGMCWPSAYLLITWDGLSTISWRMLPWCRPPPEGLAKTSKRFASTEQSYAHDMEGKGHHSQSQCKWFVNRRLTIEGLRLS